MKLIFGQNAEFFLVESSGNLDSEAVKRLEWMLNAKHFECSSIAGTFIGPRREMITPWSTNATDIATNIGVPGVERVERFFVCLDPARVCLLYTSPSPRDATLSRMPSSA